MNKNIERPKPPSLAKHLLERCLWEGEVFEKLGDFEEAFLPGGNYQFGQHAIDHSYQKRQTGGSEYVGYLDNCYVLVLAVRQKTPEKSAQEKTLQSFDGDNQNG